MIELVFKLCSFNITKQICEEESYATALGLQLFYNFCYRQSLLLSLTRSTDYYQLSFRCEMGQEAVSYVCDVDFFANIHHNHSGKFFRGRNFALLIFY